jgi:hypothetical protein
MKHLIAALMISLVGGSALAGPVCAQVFKAEVPAFDAKTSWGLQIFDYELSRLGNFMGSMEGKDNNQKIDFILAQDGRTAFFRLQAAARVFQDRDPKYFDGMRAVFKSSEDAIGKVDLAKTLKDTAATIQDAELVKYFSLQEQAARKDLIDNLGDLGLLDTPAEAIAHWKKSLDKSDKRWQSGKEDKDFLISYMSKYAKELQEKTEKMKFDKADIEEGYHELRRRIRWVTIQVSAFEGLVVYADVAALKPKVQTWFDEMSKANADLLTNKYIQFKPAKIAKPMVIPQREFAMLGNLVTQIGTSKNSAEAQIYFREALEALGSSEARISEVEKKLQELQKTEEVDHRALSVGIQKRLNETELLNHFAKDLEKLND